MVWLCEGEDLSCLGVFKSDIVVSFFSSSIIIIIIYLFFYHCSYLVICKNFGFRLQSSISCTDFLLSILTFEDEETGETFRFVSSKFLPYYCFLFSYKYIYKLQLAPQMIIPSYAPGET